MLDHIKQIRASLTNLLESELLQLIEHVKVGTPILVGSKADSWEYGGVR